jgi:hypothetical protein
MDNMELSALFIVEAKAVPKAVPYFSAVYEKMQFDAENIREAVMECVPTENAVSPKIRLSRSPWILPRNTATDNEIFASADSITIGRIGERHGPEARRYVTGF